MITGIGCDIVKIERLKQNHAKIALRILSVSELELYQSFNGERQLQFLAGRFAAKEAIFKAHNDFEVMSNIEILEKNGKPYCETETHIIHVSISHEAAYAIAYATCVKKG